MRRIIEQALALAGSTSWSRKLRLLLWVVGVAGMAMTLWSAEARAATAEEKCLSGRAKAKGKYEKCIADQIGKFHGGLFPAYLEFVDKLTKCRIKYDRRWAKLQGLGTTCAVASRYTDNFDGTVTDNLTGLVWEKKGRLSDTHDQNAQQSWSADLQWRGNGDAFSTFLRNGLNAGAGFAAANDWRLPTLAELLTILLPEEYPCSTSPCVPTTFSNNCTPGCTVTTCSCTAPEYYWTATTYAGDPGYAYCVTLGTNIVDGGFVSRCPKNTPVRVRAVRGGL